MSRSAFIVGQGLAGTLLGLELERRGWRIRVIDQGHRDASSMVAGGLWNPVSFKTLGSTWMADECIREVEHMYPKLEELLGIRFYHPTSMVRVFASQQEASLWEEKCLIGSTPWLRQSGDEALPPQFHAPFGYGIVTHTGWADVPLLLKAARKRWMDSGILREETFDESACTNKEGCVSYRDEHVQVVVWCTGWQNQGKAFGWLPIIPNKGEVLTLAALEGGESHILNFGKFLLPLRSGRYKLGSTFSPHASDPSPSDLAKESLLRDLRCALPNGNPVVVDHQAGFRPTIPDRKPIVGKHPEKPSWYCFNGFGSRGVLTIPFLSNALADSLDGAGSLPDAVSIDRYRKLFSG